MNETLKNKLIAALDIGTDKTCAMIGKVEQDNSIFIVGYGYRRSKGVKGGVIVDIKETADVVRTVISDAEKMCGELISGVIVNTPVSEIFSTFVTETIPINDEGEVKPFHIKKIIDTAVTKANILGGGLIHKIPYNYFTDGANDIENPVGLPATSLGIRINLISSNINSLKTIDKVLFESRITQNEKVICPLASSLGCLENDENGIVIDIGSGKTSISVFFENHLIYAGFYPFGGSLLTTKISNDLTISFDEAERIKTLYGCAFVSPLDKENEIRISPIGENESPCKISVFALNNSISPVIKNTFLEIKSHLEKKGIYNIPSKRIVLTGGGSLLQGMRDVASSVFEGRQIRIGHPVKIKSNFDMINNAAYTNIAGLLQFAINKKFNYHEESKNKSGVANFFKSLFMKKLTF